MALIDEMSKPKRAPPTTVVSTRDIPVVTHYGETITNHRDGGDEVDVPEFLHCADWDSHRLQRTGVGLRMRVATEEESEASYAAV